MEPLPAAGKFLYIVLPHSGPAQRCAGPECRKPAARRVEAVTFDFVIAAHIMLPVRKPDDACPDRRAGSWCASVAFGRALAERMSTAESGSVAQSQA
ncbi:hypothetical protein KHC28_14890 [Ancylobacter sonchi]|uniref:hypothetical protein n=1 Tax=Ancylobacter sonchi TaxID=1937790 RepID=UPI001BD3085D|nr:hypothetical protein [Ancylobacter sonchi]MBS7534941.1 hypothetical protein [Ancylobacter sonchi]